MLEVVSQLEVCWYNAEDKIKLIEALKSGGGGIVINDECFVPHLKTAIKTTDTTFETVFVGRHLQIFELP